MPSHIKLKLVSYKEHKMETSHKPMETSAYSLLHPDEAKYLLQKIMLDAYSLTQISNNHEIMESLFQKSLDRADPFLA
jgi:hypothetical protein